MLYRTMIFLTWLQFYYIWAWPTTLTTTPQIESPTSIRDRDCGIEDPEQLVDDVMGKVHNVISGRRAYLMHRTGIVNLGPGQLIGLKTLNRSGSIDTVCNDSVVILSVPLATAKPIRARYDWDQFFDGKTEKGLAHARASSYQGRVTLSRSTNETNANFRVIDVLMTPSDDVEVNVSGLSHISWYWSRTIKYVTTSMLKAMNIAADDMVRHAFTDAFASYTNVT